MVRQKNRVVWPLKSDAAALTSAAPAIYMCVWCGSDKEWCSSIKEWSGSFGECWGNLGDSCGNSCGDGCVCMAPYWPYLGIADGLSIALVWACRYSK